jgi:hypothetical protein
MTDPYDFTPLRQHIANVLSDHASGGGDGLDDSVQAIFDHPEFKEAWDVYQKAHPEHGMWKEIGGVPHCWDAVDQVWRRG